MKVTKDKILVVDDEQMIRWTLIEALRGWGYVPVEAGTVADAINTFDAELPSAVLLDIDLPDGSGLDALREIKSHQPDAVVIMITGNVIERALILEEGDMITTATLPRGLNSESATATAFSAESVEGDGPGWKFNLPAEGLSLEEVELSLVRQAIEQSGGNQSRAAELLSISRDQLRYRLKKLADAVNPRE